MTVKNRGQEGTRTLDQLIKSQLLYQLSYLPDIAHWKYNFLKSKKKILLCCAARGHALAVCTLLAPLRSTSSSKRAPPARNKPAPPSTTHFSTLTNQIYNQSSHHENAALANLYWAEQGV